jgi:hypothetical protein
VLTDHPLVANALDRDLIGFITAIDEKGASLSRLLDWIVSGGDEEEVLGSGCPRRLTAVLRLGSAHDRDG